MDKLLDVVDVTAFPDYSLVLRFENGEIRVFDMAALLDKKPFTQIKNPARFLQARIDCGTVAWPGEIDISPETLYDQSRPVQA